MEAPPESQTDSATAAAEAPERPAQSRQHVIVLSVITGSLLVLIYSLSHDYSCYYGDDNHHFLAAALQKVQLA